MIKFIKNKNKNLFLEFCFYLMFGVLPFVMILFPITLGLLIIGFILLGDKSNILARVVKNKALLLLVAYYFLGVIGIFYSLELGFKYKRISTQLPLLIVPLLFASLKLNLNLIRKAKDIFIISCIIFCVTALVTLGFNFVVNYEHRLNYNFIQRSMYHFHYPYDVLYINTANIFLLFGERYKKYKLVMSTLFFVVIVLSGVRIGLFSFLLVVLIYGLVNFKQLFNFKTLLFLIAFSIFNIILINSSKYVNDKFYDSLDKLGLGTGDYVSDIGEDYHKFTLRTKLWLASYEVFKERKIGGYGPKGSQTFLDRVYIEKGYKNLEGLNSHNQYITTTLNHGIVGLLLLLSIFLIVIYKSFKSRGISQLLVTLIILMSFCTESMLERQKGVVFFSVFLSLFLIESSLLLKKDRI